MSARLLAGMTAFLLGGMSAAASPAFAQSMPDRVYLALANDGHERLADRIADRLKPAASVDRGDVEDLLERWSRASGGPQGAWEWLAVGRLWLRAGEPARAMSALQRAADGIPPGLLNLDLARIGYLSGDDSASERYWDACIAADEEASLEAWLDVEILATPAEAEEWDAFRRLPAGQRDDCAFFRRFWAQRAAASGISIDERVRVHYERLRFAMNHFLRRGRAQEVSVSGQFNARLGREARPTFDDRGMLYIRLGPPDDVASFLGGECYEPNVSWYYRLPAGDRMYHLSPLEGVDNWWMIPNLAELFRCPVGADGSIIQDRSPMIARAPSPAQIPPNFLQDLYLSRAGLDPAYARMAYRMGGLRSSQELQDERDVAFADGLYAVAEIPERPDVAQDVGFLAEWIEFRLPRAEQTRVWLLMAVSGDDLRGAVGEGVEEVELDVSVLEEASGSYEHLSERVSLPEPGSDVIARLPLDLAPGEYSTRVVVRAGSARDPTLFEGDRPSGGFIEGSLAVRDFGGTLPRLSDIAVSPDSGGTWAQVSRVALSPSPLHATNSAGRMWVYFEAYNLTPGGAYSAVVHLDPEDGGTPFDLEFAGTAADGGRVVTRSGLRLDLADSPAGKYRLSLTIRDAATGRVTLPAHTGVEILPLVRPPGSVAVQP